VLLWLSFGGGEALPLNCAACDLVLSFCWSVIEVAGEPQRTIDGHGLLRDSCFGRPGRGFESIRRLTWFSLLYHN